MKESSARLAHGIAASSASRSTGQSHSPPWRPCRFACTLFSTHRSKSYSDVKLEKQSRRRAHDGKPCAFSMPQKLFVRCSARDGFVDSGFDTNPYGEWSESGYLAAPGS